MLSVLLWLMMGVALAVWGWLFTYFSDDPFKQLGGLVIMCTAIVCILGAGILAKVDK